MQQLGRSTSPSWKPLFIRSNHFQSSSQISHRGTKLAFKEANWGVIMGNFAKYSRNLKAVVLAGTMALIAVSAVAQQEVDPDHFDGNQTVTVPKNHGSKTHKQPSTAQVNTASKPSVRQAKANKNSGKARVVTVAAH
jgi:hypothetical protein